MSKLKNEEELFKAYQSLEKEFTKKSQKLAILEKSGEIKNLKIILDSAIEHYDQLSKEYAVIKPIECLEDVRDSILDISNGWWMCFKDGNQYMTSTDLQGCLEEIIDQKIGELKNN